MNAKDSLFFPEEICTFETTVKSTRSQHYVLESYFGTLFPGLKDSGDRNGAHLVMRQRRFPDDQTSVESVPPSASGDGSPESEINDRKRACNSLSRIGALGEGR